MTQQEILEELYKLPLDEQLAVIAAVLHRVRAEVAYVLQAPVPITGQQRAAAAELMHRDYETDPGVPSFTALDGEDYHTEQAPPKTA